jgi:hypothetical protein
MPLRPKAGGPPTGRPLTVAGLWLRAAIVRDNTLRDQLVHQLDGGANAWNRDVAGFMQAACDVAVRRYFGPGYDVRAVTELVSFLRRASHDGGITSPGQLEMEAVLRHALGETGVDVKGINARVAFEIQSGVTAFIAWKLELTEPQVDGLIREAEQLAVARGWSPPLAV